MVSSRENIEQRLPFLTGQETKVANYILSHYSSVIQCTVADLAQKADVSEATIVRFCRSIGYKGFTDFKINTARDIIPKERQLDPVVVEGDSTETICRKIFASEQKVLENTLENLNFDAVQEVSEKILHAGKLAIYGTGGSNAVATDARHKFLKIGIAALIYSDVDLQLMSSTLLGEGDVAMCISYSGSNLHVINCMKNAKAKGAYCVGIISQPKTPLDKIVHTRLSAAYDLDYFQSESVSTRIAQLAILDCIVSSRELQDYDRFNNIVNETRIATTESKY